MNEANVNPDRPGEAQAFPNGGATGDACPGMTIRTFIAAMAMQGMLASGGNPSDVARYAVIQADSLIYQLAEGAK